MATSESESQSRSQGVPLRMFAPGADSAGSPGGAEHDSSWTPDRVGDLLGGLRGLLDAIHSYNPRGSGESLIEVLSAHLGVPVASVGVTEQQVPEHRFVDYDLALQAIAERDPAHRLIGIAGDMRHHAAFSDLITGVFGPAPVVGQPDYVNLPTGPTSERACVGFGLRLFAYEGTPLVVLERRSRPDRGNDASTFEVLASDRGAIARFLTEFAALATELSVLRGQVLTFERSGFRPDASGVTFLERPQVDASQVILADGVLDRIRQHVLGIAEHREALLNQGQHLKRGVLLYGPPGSGKTHTVRHLLSEASGHTVILLAGETLRFIGAAATIARVLAPAIVVLEDCDLVAESRDFSPGMMKPLLFEVLDAIDGLDADADVTFLLTTNRVDVMESALTQRPGRVDLAVEIPLPEASDREKLIRLYAPSPTTFSKAAISAAASGTVGTTASFAKELVRRAVLRATLAGAPVADAHLDAAVAELMSDAEELSRALLGHPGSRRPNPGGMRSGFGLN